MRFSFIILFLFLVAGCRGNKDKIIGIWKVESLSEYPLSIINDVDILFDKGSTIVLSDNIINIYLTDTTSTPESYYYKIVNDDLVIMYSDMGTAFNIDKLTKNELILSEEYFENPDAHEKRVFKLKFVKKNNR